MKGESAGWVSIRGLTRSRLSGPAGMLALYSVGLALHTFLRGHADDLGRAFVRRRSMEQLLFHGIPTLWLQRWTPDYAAVEWLAVVIHASCFVVPLILMFLVYKRTGARKAFELVLLQLLMFYTADLIYTFYPTRPPWMHDDVTRIIVTVYGHTAAIDNNPLAATPSLHVAVPMLFTFWFARQGDRKLRRFSLPLALWTLAIAWAVVYTGEHYMVDVLAGAALSVAICVAFDLVRKNVSALVPRPNAAAAQPSLPAGQPASAFVGEE